MGGKGVEGSRILLEGEVGFKGSIVAPRGG